MSKLPTVDAEMSPLERFAAVLRLWRDNRGLSQAGLARVVLVHRDFYRQDREGRRWPTHDLVLRCEATLDAGGALARLWPEIETEPARLQLLGAQDRLSAKLQDAVHLGLPRQPRQRQPAAPEGSLLGTGSVTIVTPLKQEAIKSRPVIALEDVVGAQRLGDLALVLGLTPRFETVPIGGQIDLDRPNLVIICGPRLSITIAALLDTDPSLRFVRAPDGPWTLLDHNPGKTYRSGQDQQPARTWDVAYLARLKRPDRQGSLLVFTGIHPQGSLGVVSMIIDQVKQLHAEVGSRDFSTLIGTEYHPDTSEQRTAAGEPFNSVLLAGRATLMRVTMATEAAPGHRNEDFAASTASSVVLLDGAGVSGADDGGCVHGVAWYVRRLGAEILAGLVDEPASDLTLVLANAIGLVADSHRAIAILTIPARHRRL